MEIDAECLGLPEIEEMIDSMKYTVKYTQRWKLIGTGREKRDHAKNYAAMYASYVSKPDWLIADQ